MGAQLSRTPKSYGEGDWGETERYGQVLWEHSRWNGLLSLVILKVGGQRKLYRDGDI